MWLNCVIELIESFHAFEILKSQCFLNFLRCTKISKCFTFAIRRITGSNWFIFFLILKLFRSIVFKQVHVFLFLLVSYLLLFVEFNWINGIGPCYHFAWVMLKWIQISSFSEAIFSITFWSSCVWSTFAPFFFYVGIFTRH